MGVSWDKAVVYVKVSGNLIFRIIELMYRSRCQTYRFV